MDHTIVFILFIIMGLRCLLLTSLLCITFQAKVTLHTSLHPLDEYLVTITQVRPERDETEALYDTSSTNPDRASVWRRAGGEGSHLLIRIVFNHDGRIAAVLAGISRSTDRPYS